MVLINKQLIISNNQTTIFKINKKYNKFNKLQVNKTKFIINILKNKK